MMTRDRERYEFMKDLFGEETAKEILGQIDKSNKDLYELSQGLKELGYANKTTNGRIAQHHADLRELEAERERAEKAKIDPFWGFALDKPKRVNAEEYVKQLVRDQQFDAQFLDKPKPEKKSINSDDGWLLDKPKTEKKETATPSDDPFWSFETRPERKKEIKRGYFWGFK